MAPPSSQSHTNSGKRKDLDDEKARLLKCKRRKATMFKKCHELAVKSDAQVCVVCVGAEGEIEVWPNPEKAKAMLMKHKEERAEKKDETEKAKHLDKSKTEEKGKGENDSCKLLDELDSKLETLNEKIQKLNNSKATYKKNSANFTDVYAWNDLLPYQPGFSWVEPNQPIHYTEDSMAVSVDMGSTFNSSNSYNRWWVPQSNGDFAMNETWQSELIGIKEAKDYSAMRENQGRSAFYGSSMSGEDNIEAICYPPLER